MSHLQHPYPSSQQQHPQYLPSQQQSAPMQYSDYHSELPYKNPPPTLTHVEPAPRRRPLASLPVTQSNIPAEKDVADPPKRFTRSTYTARELFDILQTGITVQYFTAKYGERGAKDKEFGNAVHALGISGSDVVLKTRLAELLAYHENPKSAPDAIFNAISGSSYEESFGAPMDLLTAQKRRYEDKTDGEKDKIKKKADEDKKGGEEIRFASLNRSRRTASRATTDSDDDAVVITDQVTKTAAQPLSTPKPPIPDAPPVLRDWSPPASLIGAADDARARPAGDANGDDSETKKAAVTKTPVPSIPDTARKPSAKNKRTNILDSDDENTTPSRSTKRIKRNTSFDVEGFLKEERADRRQFQEKILAQMEQGNTDFRKATKHTHSFQTEFLGLVGKIFADQN
ncbi:hypothetical protein C8J57DRAFT_1247603 [Mycena rebaudengoi]|nr:hypothetical protein C8J57DRAFT_1247603 [Mycena rebaudengoi]